MISYPLSCVSKWEGKLLILPLRYSHSGQLYYIAPAYLSLVRTLCWCIKDLPVKYFHTSCSQKVTKYFLSSLISSAVCMNSLAVPYPFLECFTCLVVQFSKPPVVPWRKGIFWANVVPRSKCKYEAFCPQKVQPAHAPLWEIPGLWVIMSFAPQRLQWALMDGKWCMDLGFCLTNHVHFYSTIWVFCHVAV